MNQPSLSARRARHEARQAHHIGYRLPADHPYRSLPVWLPFSVARIVSRFMR